QRLRRPRAAPVPDRRQISRHAVHGPRLLALPAPLAVLVGAVASAGVALGIAGLILGTWRDALGLLALAVLVGVARSVALELDRGSLSVGAVGALTGAALFGPRAALPLAATTALVDWSERRSPPHRALFNVGTLSLAAMAA